MFGFFRLLAVVSAFAVNGAAAGDLSVIDDFADGELNDDVWCPCQINMRASPFSFPVEMFPPADRAISIPVDDASLGGNRCRRSRFNNECRDRKGDAKSASARALSAEGEDTALEREDLPEPLGPSLVRMSFDKVEAAKPDGNPYCTNRIKRRARLSGEEGTCIQRQEVGLHPDRRHAVDVAHDYALRFRMPENIENETDSIRWVITQWKHGPIHKKYCEDPALDCEKEWGPSPFLAQRFDDGVFYITVQDEHCRCKIASALDANGSKIEWSSGVPQLCVSGHPSHPPMTPCTPDLYATYGTKPVLSSPRGQWVEMRYRIRASRPDDGMIEVYEGDRLIVRVTGKLGYDLPEMKKSRVKFKFGNYRDYQPFAHKMDVDWVRLKKTTDRRIPRGRAD